MSTATKALYQIFLLNFSSKGTGETPVENLNQNRQGPRQ